MPDSEPTPELHGLDPGELLARAMQTVQPTSGTAAWTPPAPEELARLLPQYRIESLLGHGGMGAVYKGWQSTLDRPVAIKLLPAEIAGDAQFIGRFEREARTLARLQHPGIVAVYDFGQTSEGHLYFVMEFIDGTDLQQILRGPRLDPGQALEAICQICEALHYAHRQGVIHRDIKPANILFTRDGRAKLADFGLARPVTEHAGGLTQTNMVMGTPDYMAPEQREGLADQRADIYALGVMLYEMLTGQRPHGVFAMPSKKAPVDPRLDDVVVKALQQEPADRYQQVSEMQTDVNRIRSTPPGGIAAENPGGTRSRVSQTSAGEGGGPRIASDSKIKDTPERVPPGVGALVVVVALLLLGGAFVFWKTERSQPTLAAASTPEATSGGTRSRVSPTSAGEGGGLRTASARKIRDTPERVPPAIVTPPIIPAALPTPAPIVVATAPVLKPAPTPSPATPMPVIAQNPPPPAATPLPAKPEPAPSLLPTFSRQIPNISAWVLAPLDQSVPADIRQNLTFLREDLVDEAKRQPAASPAAYQAGAQLCHTLLAILDERTQTQARAGFSGIEANARTGVTSQALEARRNYMMSWPQYAREESQRAELKSQAKNNAAIIAERPKLEWSQRTAQLSKILDTLYAQFRAALRQSPAAK